MFIYNTIVHLKDTDATGVLYFAQQFDMALKTWETYLAHSGLSLGDIWETSDFLIPIVHAEADFKAPLRVGDSIAIHFSIGRIGTTSFNTTYELMKGESLVGTVNLVHVTVSRATREAIPIPRNLLSLLLPTVPAQ